MNTFVIKSLDEIDQVAAEFVALIGKKRVFAFHGEMGAGKTTFIKAICHSLGVREPVTSPTFAIVNEYSIDLDHSIYHFDFYRISKLDEAYDFGYEDYFYSGNLCLIEWPEKVEAILPDDCVIVTVSVNADNTRTITVI